MRLLSHSFARLLFLCLFFSGGLQAQQIPAFDSSYYTVYPQLITGRLFLSQKYTSLRIQEPASSSKLLYRPNTPLAIGVGATYRAVTLSVAAGVVKDKDKGKTKTLDLLTHVYTRKWIGDIFGQFYKGYYISDQGYAAVDPGKYYARPDIRLSLIGLSAYRVFNDKRFSFRAAFLQNEWQKRSAGTFLLGGEAYHGIVRGDSAFVPAALSSLYTQAGIDKIRFFEIGPGAGYAYTLVVKQHLFITGAVNANADLNYTKEFASNTSTDKFSFSPNVSFRSAAGYNGAKWSVNVSWISHAIQVNGTSYRDDYFIRAGNYRLTFVKRFQPGKGLRRVLKVVDWIPYL